MPLIRYKKIFPSDAYHPQQYLSKYSRVAVIDTVNTDAGTCVIRWLDNPGGRQDVSLLQGSWGEYNMPVKGAIVVCQFDQFDQARIVRYANLNQVQRMKTPAEGGDGTLPKLKAGEKYWESSGGAYIYMTDAGRIMLASPFEDAIEIDPDLNQIKSKAVNWKVVTVGGEERMGVVLRWSAATGANTVPTDGIPSVTFGATGTPLTEYVLAVNDIQGASTPVFKMTIGTVVNDLGVAVGRNDLPAALPGKQLAARITLTSGVQIDIDKDGRLSLTGVRMNVNDGSADASDTDVALALEVNNAALGTRGQHAAREHDRVTIPCSTTYADAEHAGLALKATANVGFLSTLAAAIVSPAGPCSLNPLLLTGDLKLEGEITEGASNVLVGDS
jgi:hypothetical protein